MILLNPRTLQSIGVRSLFFTFWGGPEPFLTEPSSMLVGIKSWRVRSRIFGWYDRLAKLDQELLADRCDRRLEQLVARLNWIEG
jgi:hypothetical protein